MGGFRVRHRGGDVEPYTMVADLASRALLPAGAVFRRRAAGPRGRQQAYAPARITAPAFLASLLFTLAAIARGPVRLARHGPADRVGGALAEGPDALCRASAPYWTSSIITAGTREAGEGPGAGRQIRTTG